jgi:hypothetical protein
MVIDYNIGLHSGSIKYSICLVYEVINIQSNYKLGYQFEEAIAWTLLIIFTVNLLEMQRAYLKFSSTGARCGSPG